MLWGWGEEIFYMIKKSRVTVIRDTIASRTKASILMEIPYI